VIILTSLIKQGRVIYTPADLCLKALLDKQGNYQLLQSFESSDPDSIYRYELFAR
jgi:hypothetical protein